jgi:hypothetical protein
MDAFQELKQQVSYVSFILSACFRRSFSLVIHSILFDYIYLILHTELDIIYLVACKQKTDGLGRYRGEAVHFSHESSGGSIAYYFHGSWFKYSIYNPRKRYGMGSFTCLPLAIIYSFDIPLRDRCEHMISFSFYFVALPGVEFVVVILSLGEVYAGVDAPGGVKVGADVLGGVVCTFWAYASWIGNAFAVIEAATAIANVNDAITIVYVINVVLAVILEILQNMFYKKSRVNFLKNQTLSMAL